MNLNYVMLLKKISKEQKLGLQWNEIPLIINTDLTTYKMAYITYEDDEYIAIIVPDKTGAEYAKIISKSTVLSIEIVYQQMVKLPKALKGDVSYV